MDKTEIINEIKLLLGGGVLELEVDTESLSKLIDMAYKKIKPYITDTVMLTRAYAQVIDLKDESIEDVVRVYPAENTIYNQDRMFDFEGIKLDSASIKQAVMGSYPVVNSEIKFKFYDGKIYLESDKVYTGIVTIEALHTPTLESLKDERAESWISAYSLALAKQVCGRIRSKFKSSNVPVELDGDTLLSEAQTEMQMLESDLQDRQFGPFMILR